MTKFDLNAPILGGEAPSETPQLTKHRYRESGSLAEKDKGSHMGSGTCREHPMIKHHIPPT